MIPRVWVLVRPALDCNSRMYLGPERKRQLTHIPASPTVLVARVQFSVVSMLSSSS